MSVRHRCVLAMVGCLSLGISTVGAAAAVTGQPAGGAPVPVSAAEEEPVELTGLRDAYSETFANADGTRTTVQHGDLQRVLRG